MLLCHFESQSENGLLESFTAGLQHTELSDVIQGRVLTVDEPRQLHGRLWSARCAVHVDSVADLVARTAAGDSRIRFGQH